MASNDDSKSKDPSQDNLLLSDEQYIQYSSIKMSMSCSNKTFTGNFKMTQEKYQDFLEKLNSNVGVILDKKMLQYIHHEDLKNHLDECIKPRSLDPLEGEIEFQSLENNQDEKQSKHANDSKCGNKTNEECGDNKSEDLVSQFDVIKTISESSEFWYLLNHPVIRGFVHIHWYKYTPSLYLSIFQSGMLCLFLIIHKYINPFGLLFLGIFLTMALIVELFDMYVSRTKYFKQYKNYVDFTMIILTFYVIVIDFTTPDQQESLSFIKTSKLIISIGILVSLTECLLFLGLISKCSKYTLMLVRVSTNFIKFMLYYFFVILAFAYSLHKLLKPCSRINNYCSKGAPGSANENVDVKVGGAAVNLEDSKGGENEGNPHFQTFELAVYKTMIMLTGEYDAESIDYKQYPLASRMVLVIFIFGIAIVLMNLLTGLAVSDIDTIEKEAVLLGLHERIKHMCHMEKYLRAKTRIYKSLRIKESREPCGKKWRCIKYLMEKLNIFNSSNLIEHMPKDIQDDIKAIIKDKMFKELNSK